VSPVGELKAPSTLERRDGHAWTKRATWASGTATTDATNKWPAGTGVAISGTEFWNGKLVTKTIARLIEITMPATGDVFFHTKATDAVGHSEGADQAIIERDKGWFCVMGVSGRQSATVTQSPGMSYYNLATDPSSRVAITHDTSNTNYRIFQTRANWGEKVFPGFTGPGATWDSSRNKIVMWGNDEPTGSSYNSLYTLHLTGSGSAVNVSIERHDLTGDQITAAGNFNTGGGMSGVYRKFVYLPQENAFVAYTGYASDFHVFRLAPALATKQIAVPQSLAITVGTPA